MIIFTLHLTISSKIKDEVLHIVHSLIGPTEAYPSCIRCRLYDDTGNNNEILLLEEWESQEELEQHIRSHEFRKILALMDLANKPPEVSFHTVSNTAGLELVEALLL